MFVMKCTASAPCWQPDWKAISVSASSSAFQRVEAEEPILPHWELLQ